MIIGAHALIYSRRPEADRAFLRDVLSLPHVDVGEGWLIFGLPPAEVAVHPLEAGDEESHELYLLCEDAEGFADAMRARNIQVGPIENRGWGLLTSVTLPGGGTIGVYEPRHARPKTPGARTTRARRAVARSKGARKKAQRIGTRRRARRTASRR
jgi:hypothetical protein